MDLFRSTSSALCIFAFTIHSLTFLQSDVLKQNACGQMCIERCGKEQKFHLCLQ